MTTNYAELVDSLRVPDYVKSTTVIQRVDTLTKRQLDYWITSGWIATFEVRPGRGKLRHIYYPEYYRVGYMAHLVNRMGFEPMTASRLAEKIVAEGVRSKGLIWVNHKDSMLGVPIFKDHQ